MVTAIFGQSRFNVTFTGEAAHAGTTPMTMRRDALTAAAEFVLAVERLALGTEGLVATVGKLQVPHGAGNVVPGRVELSLDVRHADDIVRADAIATLQAGGRDGIDVSWEPIHHHEATPCAPALRAKLADAVAATGQPVLQLPSGAGHDAVTLSGLTDIAILFVRSTGGSHNPGEAVTEPDVALAIDAATRFACSI